MREPGPSLIDSGDEIPKTDVRLSFYQKACSLLGMPFGNFALRYVVENAILPEKMGHNVPFGNINEVPSLEIRLGTISTVVACH